MKTPSVSTLKKRLDRIFSEYIRRRDARTNPNGYVSCCSCGQVAHWKQMDAGHYISRKHNTTRYHPKNVHAQCRQCNRYDEGNKSGYSLFLTRAYGPGIIAALDHLGHQSKRFRAPELLELIAEYRAKLKRLK